MMRKISVIVLNPHGIRILLIIFFKRVFILEQAFYAALEKNMK
jgi:hypothetical protein